MLKKIGIAIVVVIAAILVFAATKPDHFHIERSAVINAKPPKVFSQINDFHNWGVWDPWAKLDPSMKTTYSGSANGKGAVYEWEGNGQVGAGRMEITDSVPSSKIDVKLDFLKPFEGHNTATFTLAAQGDSTQVTWAMDGPTHFLNKVMTVFMNMDKMIGGQFDAGLANLKAVAEAPAN
jgi:hypothetical protein